MEPSQCPNRVRPRRDLAGGHHHHVLSASNHLTAPAIALPPPFSVTGFPPPGLDFAIESEARRSRHDRIEFVILRIARSPRVALCAASRPGQSPERFRFGLATTGDLSQQPGAA